MAYREIHCQLCGVSFSIARLRRSVEAEEAAWSYNGDDFVQDWHQKDCQGVSGCRILQEGTRAGEHIAGPGCISTHGYSGYRISLEEMKGCRAVQCLVEKDADWMPEDDDQDFEVEGGYFLTGVGDCSTDQAPLRNTDPIRHGFREIWPSNVDFEVNDGLPFHPTCFDMYKKICAMRIGKVDTEGLYSCCQLDYDLDSFFECVPRNPAVRRGNEQWWRHEPGCEYLVANPTNIPGLSQLIQSQEKRVDKRTIFGDTEVPDNSKNSTDTPMPHTSNAGHDPFSLLSADITSMILDYLRSQDIANLRLATPVFRQLPTILFRRLLMEDMPWFFEVKDLDVAKFNWYDLYCTLKSSLKDLKGLRNRERIWRDLEGIVQRIKWYRKEGKIPMI